MVFICSGIYQYHTPELKRVIIWFLYAAVSISITRELIIIWFLYAAVSQYHTPELKRVIIWFLDAAVAISITRLS